jgi:hypothetical protein
MSVNIMQTTTDILVVNLSPYKKGMNARNNNSWQVAMENESVEIMNHGK